MTIDITDKFPHKKAFSEGEEISIKKILCHFDVSDLDPDGEIIYIARLQIISRSETVFSLNELSFIL